MTSTEIINNTLFKPISPFVFYISAKLLPQIRYIKPKIIRITINTVSEYFSAFIRDAYCISLLRSLIMYIIAVIITATAAIGAVMSEHINNIAIIS